jgi:hypothetical protein
LEGDLMDNIAVVTKLLDIISQPKTYKLFFLFLGGGILKKTSIQRNENLVKIRTNADFLKRNN